MAFYPKHLILTSFKTGHKPYFPQSVTPKTQRPTSWIFNHRYLDMFSHLNRNFRIWIIIEKTLYQKWWDDLKITYLRKHHQKNLSFLAFRPSFLHFPQNFGLDIICKPQTPIDIQYSQVWFKWESLASYLYSPSSFLKNIF